MENSRPAYWALANGGSSGRGSLIIALNPVVPASLLSLFLGHRESRRGLVALALGTCAVVVACTPKLIADHSIGGAIVAVLGLSVGGIYQGRHLSNIDPFMVSAIGLTASTPVAAIATVTAPVHVTDWPKAILLVVIMTVLTSVGATTSYAACIRQSGARAALILFAVIPAAARLMAWIGLGENLTYSPSLRSSSAARLASCRARRQRRAEPKPTAPRSPIKPRACRARSRKRLPRHTTRAAKSTRPPPMYELLLSRHTRQ